MKSIFLLSSVLIVSLNCLATSKTIDAATVAFRKYGKNVTSISMECLSFTEDGVADVKVSEKHGPNCGGDANTSPAVAHLRVKGKKILIMDLVSGEYRTLNSKYKPEY